MTLAPVRPEMELGVIAMGAISREPLNLNGEEVAIIGELLESEQSKLLVEIRHTDHRVFREELRRRLAAVDRLLERCQAAVSGE